MLAIELNRLIPSTRPSERTRRKLEEPFWVPATGYLPVKHALDFVLALGLLVVAAPILAVLWVVIRVSSRGPAVYSQVRLGLHGRPFTLYKLRSMVHNCESASGPQWSTPGDARITPLGWFLRKTHLDELPQLWNILRGEMSLIGPRPERPEFIPALERSVPLYRQRLSVRPGVTGLAQVQVPADTCIETVRNKVAYDLFYITGPGLWLDLRILIATAFKAIGGSHRIIGWLCGLPKRDVVEQRYEQLLEGR
jgi:lipopolysaccharide/colanic/teichoic acid biosynthesis glycosyltransferase